MILYLYFPIKDIGNYICDDIVISIKAKLVIKKNETFLYSSKR